MRHQRLGPVLGLSYDEPVRLNRGEGVWLIEDGDRRLLDAYNNVPHVGHARREHGEDADVSDGDTDTLSPWA